MAREALDGALGLIAQAGGGEVVSFPNELVPDKRTSSSFLRNGTRAMFEKAGFTFERHIGKRQIVMRKTVEPASPVSAGSRPDVITRARVVEPDTSGGSRLSQELTPAVRSGCGRHLAERLEELFPEERRQLGRRRSASSLPPR